MKGTNVLIYFISSHEMSFIVFEEKYKSLENKKTKKRIKRVNILFKNTSVKRNSDRDMVSHCRPISRFITITNEARIGIRDTITIMTSSQVSSLRLSDSISFNQTHFALSSISSLFSVRISKNVCFKTKRKNASKLFL